jgi:type VI secretion system secreted protein VgrG
MDRALQFHWDRTGTFDDKSSCWIRTMQPWGGAGWGVQFIPRVGMEVVVLFEGGDPDKPMVIGSVYNGTHPSPFVLPGDQTRSGWRTQSSPGGGGFNELSFEDAASQEQVYLHAQRDLDEAVERDHTRRVGEDERIAVTRDRALTVGGNQDLVTKQVRRELVGADSHLHVKGDHRQQVDQKMSVAAHDLHVKIAAKHALEAADEIHVKAGTVLVVEAGQDLTIKGPGGFIRIDAGGVTIKGTLVKINSGGSPGSAGDATPDTPDDAVEAQVAGAEVAPAAAGGGPPSAAPPPASGGGPGAPQ